jgi:hypothetical protein
MKNEKAAAILKTRTTKQLIDDLILTGAQMDATKDAEKYTNLATVRGWIMDELEERNPEAFEKWIDAYDEDEDLRKYYGVA